MGEIFQGVRGKLNQSCQECKWSDERCPLNLAVLVGMVLGQCLGGQGQITCTLTNWSEERAEGVSK